MSHRKRIKNPLAKQAKRGFRGYPVATVAFYGQDDQVATKAAVGIVEKEDGEATVLERWFVETGDIRKDFDIANQMSVFIKKHGARSVVMADRIIGCPHEEGVDYPGGEECPQCPFWAGRDRWTGQSLN